MTEDHDLATRPPNYSPNSNEKQDALQKECAELEEGEKDD